MPWANADPLGFYLIAGGVAALVAAAITAYLERRSK